MNRKYILTLSVLAFALCAAYVKPGLKEVDANIEMCVTHTQQFGKLISIVTQLKNNSEDNIYLDGCRVPRTRILKKLPSGLFKDYTEEWGLRELNEEPSKINATIGLETMPYQVFDAKSNKFLDKNIQTYFESALYKTRSLFRSKKDSIFTSKWFQSQLESLAYIKKNGKYGRVYSLNGLPEGEYKIFFNYNNKSQDVIQFEDQVNYDHLKLRLPETLNGYKRWRGEIKSDTLYLSIR